MKNQQLLSEEIRAKIEKRFGKPVIYHKDCEALAESIEKAVNERIGVTTLKRLYGIDKDYREPRKYTLDVLAQYLGYKDWVSLNDSLNENGLSANQQVAEPSLRSNQNVNESNDQKKPIAGKIFLKNRILYAFMLVGIIFLSYGVIKFIEAKSEKNSSKNLSSKIDLSNALVAFFPFNGNPNDESKSDYDGTANDATLTTDRFGEANKAYHFNGKSSYILLPVIKELSNSRQLTFSVWVKTDYDFKTPDNSACIFDQWSFTNPYTGENIGLAISFSPDKTIGIGFLGGLGQNSPSRLVVPKIWNNLTIVFDGTQEKIEKRVSIYLDGTFIGDIGNKTAPELIGHLANRTIIGASVGPFGWPSITHTIDGYFHGELDDIRIYNRVLSEQEIAYIASH